MTVLRSAVVRFQGLAFDSIAKISDALVGHKGSRGKSTQVWLRPSTTGRAFASTPKPVPMAADLAAIPGDGPSDDHLSNRASIPFRRRASHLSWHRPLGRQPTIGQQHRQEKRELLVR
jgi:hypothetical protein